MTRKIKVTQDHIDRGRPRSACRCPIALAAADAGFSRPGVGSSALNEWDDAGFLLRSWRLPSEASAFIRCIDHEMNPGPIEFEVEEWQD